MPGREPNHSFHLVTRLRISGATPSLPPYNLMSYTGTTFYLIMTFSVKGHRQQILNESLIFWATIFSEWMHVDFCVLLVFTDALQLWN